jgi:uncharacterized protein (DUF433 family)
MSAAVTKWVYLAPNPKSAYKQLFVKGTRILARILYGRYRSADEPMTPEQIAADYGLPVEAVREAIAYCETNPPEIRKDFEAEEALLAAKAAKGPAPRQALSAQEMAELRRR